MITLRDFEVVVDYLRPTHGIHLIGVWFTHGLASHRRMAHIARRTRALWSVRRGVDRKLRLSLVS